MKTQTVEAPVQVIHGYVPLIAVDHCPDWVISAVGRQHGDHTVLSDGRCMVLVDWFMRGIPPGHWVIIYQYDDENGTHDYELWVAARVR